MRYNRVFQQDRLKEVDDGQGGFEEKWVTINEALKGRMSRNSANERQEGEQIQGENDYTFYTQSGVDIARGDRLSVADGREFEVLNVIEPGLENDHVECQMEQIENRETTN